MYISRLCYDVSVRLSVCDGSALADSQCMRAHCGGGACQEEGRVSSEEWRDHLALCKPVLGPLV